MTDQQLIDAYKHALSTLQLMEVTGYSPAYSPTMAICKATAEALAERIIARAKTSEKEAVNEGE